MNTNPSHNKRSSHRLRRHSSLHSWDWDPPELTPEQLEILEKSKRNHPSQLLSPPCSIQRATSVARYLTVRPRLMCLGPFFCTRQLARVAG